MGIKYLVTTFVVGGVVLIGGHTASASTEAEETSIVDYLYNSNEEYSLDYRGELAEEYNISGYKGTAKQNVKLLDLLKDSGEYDYEPTKENKKKVESNTSKEEPKQEVKEEPKQETKTEVKQETKTEEPKQETKTEEKKEVKQEENTNTNPQGQTMTMEATAYTAFCDTGCTGVTATGIDLSNDRSKKVIAVDPNVIPLGSIVYVEGYGEAVAADTGSAIQGNRIDLHVATKEEAINFGRQTVEITIIK